MSHDKNDKNGANEKNRKKVVDLTENDGSPSEKNEASESPSRHSHSSETKSAKESNFTEEARETESGGDERPTGPILDVVKKLFSVGVGAAFMTEESIRSYLGDIKLPKDVLNFILQSANKGKEELVQRVGKEIGGLLSHIDIVKEGSKFVENHKFKISAEIEILPKNKDSDTK